MFFKNNNHKLKDEIIFLGKQSYGNLGAYDYEYLLNLRKFSSEFKITFFHSYLYDQNKVDDIEYINIFKYNKKNFFFKSFSYINSLIKIAKYVLINNPKYLHTQWFLLPFFDFLWIKMIRFFGWKGCLIQTVHNARSRYNFISRFFIKLCLKEIDSLIVHSPKCKTYLREKYNFLKNISIYVGRVGVLKMVMNSNFSFKEEKIFNQIFNLRKSSGFVFIHIGNVCKYKGFDLLYKSWIEFKNRARYKNNSSLIVLGKVDKNLKSKVKNLQKIDKSFLVYDSYVSVKLLSLAVENADYILLPHTYVSHSGIYTDFLGKYKPFIYNKNPLNHMTSHKPFNYTGIYFDQKERKLSDIFLDIDNKKLEFKVDKSSWDKAIDYFRWDKCFPKKLLMDLYKKNL